jgi:hypothetical protein
VFLQLRYNCVLLWLAMCATVTPKARGDDPFSAPDGTSKMDLPIVFASGNFADLNRLHRVNELAAIEATGVLRRHLEGGALDPGNYHAANAATVLGSLHAGGEQTVELLCKNIALQPEALAVNDRADPLCGFAAAQALVEIGGPRVAEIVIKQLKQTPNAKELLLFAHVLHRNDDVAITILRMQLARERAKSQMTATNYDRFVRNVEQVREWLGDTQFPIDEKYKPGK